MIIKQKKLILKLSMMLLSICYQLIGLIMCTGGGSLQPSEGLNILKYTKSCKNIRGYSL